jgi:hypothetical protein
VYGFASEPFDALRLVRSRSPWAPYRVVVDRREQMKYAFAVLGCAVDDE